jgi:hypothetical protein
MQLRAKDLTTSGSTEAGFNAIWPKLLQEHQLELMRGAPR